MRLLRPLLDVPKSALEAICDEAGHPFFRDPANENTRFARARLRALSATLERSGARRGALLRLGATRGARRVGAGAGALQREKDGGSRLRRSGNDGSTRPALRDLPPEISLRLLRRRDRAAAGRAPRLDRLERAAEVVAQALAEGAPKRITLAGFSIRVNNREVTLTSAPPRSRGRAKPETEPRASEEDP